MQKKTLFEEFFKVNEDLVASGLMSRAASGGNPFHETEVPTEWEPFAEFRLTPEMNRLYAFSTGDENPWYTVSSPFGGAIAHPITLVKLARQAQLRRFAVAVPSGQAGLNAKMECEFLRPAKVGILFKVEGRLAEKYIRRGRRYLVVEGRFIDEDGQEVLRYRHTIMLGKEE